MSEWISVDKRLPKIGDRVLVVQVWTDGYKGNVMEAVRYEDKKFNRFEASIEPTHWMPLPEPPESL